MNIDCSDKKKNSIIRDIFLISYKGNAENNIAMSKKLNPHTSFKLVRSNYEFNKLIIMKIF